MAAARHEHGAVGRARSGVSRAIHAWQVLEREQRLAAIAALGLFVTMLLPWYTKTNTVVVKGAPKSSQTTFTAFGAFSFVEAAVLLVSAGVLFMLFARAERRAFHLPGGDGTIIMLAGGWAALLIFYRMLDKPSLHGNDVISATEGITWGIFIALMVALALTYSGVRVRAAHRPEPPLLEPDERPDGPAPYDEHEPEPETVAAGPLGAASGARRRPPADPEPPADPPGRPRYPPAPPSRGSGPSRRMVTREDAEQLSFEDAPAEDPFGGDPPRRRPRR
jgi:hypothetical protein